MRPINETIRQKILDSALALLRDKAPDSVGMREIAAKAGITATTIYYYYGDKALLFEATKLRLLDAMQGEVIAAAKDARTPMEAIRAGLEAFAAWCLAHPREACLVMGELPANTGAAGPELEAYYRAFAAGTDALDAAVREGSARSESPTLDMACMIQAVWGAVQGFLAKRVPVEYWDKPDALIGRMIDLLLGAVRA
jgi:AcrR family transcriptional regulator